MFKDSAAARTYLRAGVSAAIAMIAVASTIWIDNPYVKLASAGVGALSAYLGVGAVVPQVEPFYGRTLPGVEVPSPPAVAEDAPATL